MAGIKFRLFKPLEIVGDTALRTTDQKVRGSNPFERAYPLAVQLIEQYVASNDDWCGLTKH